MDLNCQKMAEEERSLIGIKSETELMLHNPTNRKHSADIPVKSTKIESVSRGKARYDSSDSRGGVGGGLKIKLKPKVVRRTQEVERDNPGGHPCERPRHLPPL